MSPVWDLVCPLCFSVCLSLPLSKSQGTTVQSTIGFQQEGGGWESMAKASGTLVISGSLQGRRWWWWCFYDYHTCSIYSEPDHFLISSCAWTHLILTVPWERCYYSPCVRWRKESTGMLSMLPAVSQPVSNEADLCTQMTWLLCPCSKLLSYSASK